MSDGKGMIEVMRESDGKGKTCVRGRVREARWVRARQDKDKNRHN